MPNQEGCRSCELAAAIEPGAEPVVLQPELLHAGCWIEHQRRKLIVIGFNSETQEISVLPADGLPSFPFTLTDAQVRAAVQVMP